MPYKASAIAYDEMLVPCRTILYGTKIVQHIR